MILLGTGILYIGESALGLTRGGGQFTVEREYRNIEADGDKGPVKDRIVKEGSIAKLQINLLEFLPENMKRMYPGLTLENVTTNPAGTVISASGDIKTTDYNDTITWKGKTKDGKGVSITVKNAINLENLDWALSPKDDVVQTVTYTACYDDKDDSGLEPWEIRFEN